MTESPVAASSSSVVSQLGMPPMSRVPAGEAQLVWCHRCSTIWWDGLQTPPLNLTHEVKVGVV